MTTGYLIVGQGICGTFLSWYFKKAGIPFLIIDERRENSASLTAAGIINPVTGRRIVKTWMIEDIMPFAQQAYDSIGQELQITAIEHKSSIDFFPTRAKCVMPFSIATPPTRNSYRFHQVKIISANISITSLGYGYYRSLFFSKPASPAAGIQEAIDIKRRIVGREIRSHAFKNRARRN